MVSGVDFLPFYKRLKMTKGFVILTYLVILSVSEVSIKLKYVSNFFGFFARFTHSK